MLWLLKRAVECPDSKYKNWYVAPYLTTARDIAWDVLNWIVPPEIIKSTNESRLEIKLINGNTMALKGADKPASLRGRPVYSGFLDEFADMKPNTFSEIILPSTMDTDGNIIIAGTPKGANHFRDYYLNAKEMGIKAHPIYRTIDSPFVSKEQVEFARSQMDEKTFRQEMEGSFENWDGLIYECFSNDNIKAVRFNPNLDTYFACDFGWNDPTVILTCQYNQGNGEWSVVHEVIESGLTPEAIARLFKGETVRVANRELKLPCDINNAVIVSGHEGNARRQEAGGLSMRLILESNGIPRYKMNFKPVRIFDSVLSTRLKIKSADGYCRLFINPDCSKTIRDIQSWHYPEKEGTPYGEIPDTSVENHKHSHTMDALRYAVGIITPIKPRGEWRIGA